MLSIAHYFHWQARDLELAVPGTYRSGEEVICIRGFAPSLNVITSKQVC
jgi:FKBP12-rapamycin complex-associated protein